MAGNCLLKWLSLVDLKHVDLAAMRSAERVAVQAYQAMMRGEPFVVHGMMNRMCTTAPKWLPSR